MKKSKKTILSIFCIIAFLLLGATGCDFSRVNSSDKNLYLVTLVNDHENLDITVVEPTVENITRQMVICHFADALGIKVEAMYAMEIPEEVHKAIVDSACNVLSNPRKYMHKVELYPIKVDTAKVK
jgi:hypothetical protein